MYQFGFIGMGNMGSAMLKGCLSVFPASALAFSRKDAVKGKALSLETGAVWVDSNRACAEQSRYIILAVKPQFYDGVLKEIQPVLDDSRIIISLAPSYTIADLKQSLGASARIIRAMPNTPAMVGEGMTGLSWSEDVFSDTERQELMQFFTSFGKTETVPENLMDTVVGVSGSSPAYVFMFIEAMADEAVAEGMPRALAYEFAAQAVLGSAKMVLETGKHPGELKDMVCSPAGTTIQAVKVLEEKGFRAAVMDAMEACIEKSRNL